VQAKLKKHDLSVARMIAWVYAWFWWTTTWGLWSYWYACSTALFFIYYGLKILAFLFSGSGKRRKKRKNRLYYSSTSSGEEEEHEEMHTSYSDEEGNVSEKEQWDLQGLLSNGGGGGDDEFAESARFEDDEDLSSGGMPMSFDRMVAKLTKGVTYTCIGVTILLVLVVSGGLVITFLDKWHEERQIQYAYYQAVEECNDKSIRSEQILKACQSARREVGKSVIFGAVKNTFFEMVRSMDACVWYLKSSPAAWLLLAVGLFALACKLMWSDRNDHFPRYLKWFNRSGMKKPRRHEGRRRRGVKKAVYYDEYGNGVVPKRQDEVAIGVLRQRQVSMMKPNTAPPTPISHTRMHHTNCINVSQPS
jgi:hypothetical protein